jgi:hypothetical protein
LGFAKVKKIPVKINYQFLLAKKHLLGEPLPLQKVPSLKSLCFCHQPVGISEDCSTRVRIKRLNTTTLESIRIVLKVWYAVKTVCGVGTGVGLVASVCVCVNCNCRE